MTMIVGWVGRKGKDKMSHTVDDHDIIVAINAKRPTGVKPIKREAKEIPMAKRKSKTDRRADLRKLVERHNFETRPTCEMCGEPGPDVRFRLDLRMCDACARTRAMEDAGESLEPDDY